MNNSMQLSRLSAHQRSLRQTAHRLFQRSQAEDGTLTVQSVMLIAVSAMVMTSLFSLWSQANIQGQRGIRGAVAAKLDALFNSSFSSSSNSSDLAFAGDSASFDSPLAYTSPTSAANPNATPRPTAPPRPVGTPTSSPDGQPSPNVPPQATPTASALPSSTPPAATVNPSVGSSKANLKMPQATPATAPLESRTEEQDRLTALLFDTSATDSESGVPPIGTGNSRREAVADANRVRDLRNVFTDTGREYGLPAALLAGIASRESAVGSTLTGGHSERTGYGQDGTAYGIMQVDERYHQVDRTDGPTSRANIRQGAAILSRMRSEVRENHPTWTEAQVLRGATAAYNFGPQNVQTLSGLDTGTTNNNYSADVWARAQYFAEQIFDHTN